MERGKQMRGVIMNINISVKWDEEAQVYIAICDDIGLALESGSYDELIKRAQKAVPELLSLNNIQGCTSMSFLTEERRVACA